MLRSLQSKLLLDGVLDPLADISFAVHGKDRRALAQPNLQMAAFAGFERASLLFQPPFEFGAC
jgi:hypothetical protein